MRHEATRPLHPLLLVRPRRLVVVRSHQELAPSADDRPAVAHVRHVQAGSHNEARGGRATRLRDFWAGRERVGRGEGWAK